MSDNLLLNTSEASELLHVSPRRLREWIKNRQGPLAFKSGGQYLYWRHDVLGYVVALAQQAKEDWGRADD